jgi:hypothetical protein
LRELPSLERIPALLRSVSELLHKSIRLAVLKGINPNDHSEYEIIVLYAGLLSHIGGKRSTNAFGMSLEDIRDASLQSKPNGHEHDAELDPAKLNHGMSFHSDRVFAGILTFFVREEAARGGDQQFASFWAFSTNYAKTISRLLRG